jgi:predicted amidohydrolase
VSAAGIRISAHTYDVAIRHATPDAFESHFLGLLRQSLEEGSRVVVFPEYACYVLARVPGFTNEAGKVDNARISDFVWKRFFPKVVELSGKHRAILCAGSAPFTAQGKRVTNRALLAASGREIVCEKRSLTPWETDFAPGARTTVFEWEGLRVASLICFDSEFPEIAVELKRQQPHLVLVPSATSDRLGVERVCRSASARAVELGAITMVSPLVGTDLANPLVDVNVGRCAIYYPAQEAFRDETSRESAQFDSGLHSVSAVVDPAQLESAKKADSETKPYLKTLS